MSAALSGAILLVLAAGIPEAPPATPPDPTTVQTGASAIDPRRSSARVIVHTRIPLGTEGTLSRVGGQLLGSALLGWQVQVQADGRSLDFPAAQWMNRVTRSSAFLAVDRFPVIRFDSDVFPDAVLHGGGELRGTLSLRGLTRPVSFRLLPSTCAQPGRECDIQVQGTISRHAFGMNAHRAIVKDDVDFDIRVRLQSAVNP